MVDGNRTKCLRVDCSELISKSQIEHQISIDTGQSISQLTYLLNTKSEDVHFIIFDKIRGNMNVDALIYLYNLPSMLTIFRKNLFFIFTSSVNIKQFRGVEVELDAMSLLDTELILYDRFEQSHFTSTQIFQIHELSEGVVDKLEQIMDFLSISSVEEVLLHDDIFDDQFHLEHIPKTMLNQIDVLFSDSSKALTLRMLNILSILKNGETLTNLRKDKMGLGLNPKNTQELIRFELATTIMIDSSSMLIKVNPIIKDYILSKISREEVVEISNAYLKVTLIETQKGIKLSSINRKIYQSGYNTEEDNTCTLLNYALKACQQDIEINKNTGESNEMNLRKMNKLSYYSNSYVYILRNSSRFAEAISAVENLIEIIKVVDEGNLYKYYEHIASSHRIKSNYLEAGHYLDLCEKLCPKEDKQTLENIYTERLYLLEQKDLNAAIRLAKENKNNYHKNSIAYISSEVILAESKASDLRIRTLVKLEKRARNFGFNTLANNILFTINNDRSNAEKINNLDKAIRSDNSAYNFCRATVYKYQAYIECEMIDRIKDSDIGELLNIYNYLYRQKFENLFNKCHRVLWNIAEYHQRKDIIHLIFFKGTIVWRLNSDHEREKKYHSLFQGFSQEKLTVLDN